MYFSAFYFLCTNRYDHRLPIGNEKRDLGQFRRNRDTARHVTCASPKTTPYTRGPSNPYPSSLSATGCDAPLPSSRPEKGGARTELLRFSHFGRTVLSQRGTRAALPSRVTCVTDGPSRIFQVVSRRALSTRVSRKFHPRTPGRFACRPGHTAGRLADRHTDRQTDGFCSNSMIDKRQCARFAER